MSWEFDGSLWHFLDTHTVLICECWKEDLTSARLTSLDRSWRTWFWIVPPDMIFFLMRCTVADCNYPWPSPCRTRLLDSLVVSWIDGNLRYKLGMIMCIKWHSSSLILLLLKNDEGDFLERAWASHLIMRAAPIYSTTSLPDLIYLCVETWRCWCASNALICWLTHSRQRLQRLRPSSVDSGTDRSRGLPKVKSE